MSFEQRIGERFDVGDIPVRWQTGRPAKPTRAQRKRRDPDIFDRGYLRSVSMSGAAALAAADPALGPGSTVEVRLDDELWFVARVRRVLESSDPCWSYYGLAYLQVSEPFQAWLNSLVHHRRAGLSEGTWRQAH